MTATDEPAMLAVICAEPEEDTPRLMYADWLDEHAESVPCPVSSQLDPGWAAHLKCCDHTGSVPDGRAARAEFIRVQCELARWRCPWCEGRGTLLGSAGDRGNPACDCGVLALRTRERELFERHRIAWFHSPGVYAVLHLRQTAGTHGIGCVVSRGFVSHLTVPRLDTLLTTCQMCQGGGYVPTDRDDNTCEVCGGSGLVPTPAARELFGGPDCQPVTGVRVSDREPLWDGTVGLHGWFRDDTGTNPSDLPDLPAALWDALLLPGHIYYRNWKGADTAADAHLALSAAVITFLRRAVKLPAPGAK
jgi:uncharacterized protein (TIGR02996 family)